MIRNLIADKQLLNHPIVLKSKDTETHRHCWYSYSDTKIFETLFCFTKKAKYNSENSVKLGS